MLNPVRHGDLYQSSNLLLLLDDTAVLQGVPRSVLQLVAVASMLLASKQDEVVHPSVEELTDIAANCFQVSLNFAWMLHRAPLGGRCPK